MAPYWVMCVEDLLYEMENWMPARMMWYLTHYLEEDYPMDAVDLVQQAQTPLDAAMELIEIVKQNLVVSGVEIDPLHRGGNVENCIRGLNETLIFNYSLAEVKDIPRWK